MSRLEWGQVLVPLFFILILLAALGFLHSGLQGERGLTALHDAERSIATLETELAALEAENAALENRVRRLDESYLDLDLLEERARSVLGYVRGDEIVIR
ncbi:septum formation initiator family protein [Limibaculum sp. FT325]|uniref:FtsB family cell division protein n=1 Tax=Thermohalobaculum sediminis TaxID=2939436 RepID=UPI0020BEC7E0|nr:septum formation initiator family protein [Limibaculum sediminis]MCL5775558.1 septum formation initiator family protein [Limibaculum sediminis]